MFHRRNFVSLMGITLAGAFTCAYAQWPNYPDSRIPRKDGKPNLTAPAPRLNGKPDLSGLWEADATPRSELDRVLPPGFFDLQVDLPGVSKYLINLLWDFKPEDDPSRPETLALLKQRGGSTSKNLPGSRCLPNSMPLTPLILPFKIVQTPQQM